jgi:hypothetical protein
MGWMLLPVAGIFLGLFGSAHAQTSLDALERDLDQVKQDHTDQANQAFSNFETALQNASSSATAAIQLYQQTGGDLPGATRVSSQHEYETPSEKAQRLAQDQANLTDFGQMLQLHCGMLRMGALFVAQPNTANLQNDWIAWLKQAAQIYPSLTGARELRDLKLKDSPISAYLKFYGWGDADQGNWSVHDLPKLFFADVLTPLRKAPNAETLAAWDSYIAMLTAEMAVTQADLASLQQQEQEQEANLANGTGTDRHEGRHGDERTDEQKAEAAQGSSEKREGLKEKIAEDENKIDKWTNEDLPELQFERGCDDFASGPTEDKLAALVSLIKDHPTHSKSDKWIARVHAMLVAFKAGHTADAIAAAIGSGADVSGAAPTAPSTDASTPPASSADTLGH